MKKKIIFGIVLLLPLIVNSQEYKYVPFPDSGAIWSEVYQPRINNDLTWPDPIYERFAVNGEDTILNDTTYKKLYIFYDTLFNKSNATYIGGIREDKNKKVYFNGDSIVIHDFKPSYHNVYNSNELLLYDFSLEIGDTLKNSNLSGFDEFLVVSGIDTILVDDNYRKIYSFEPIWWVKWIEGIGNLKGLLFTSGDIPTNGLDNELICFKYNNNILFFNEYYNDCIPLITDINTEQKEFFYIKTYPNPVKNDLIHFVFEGKDIEKIIILDCSGVIVDCIQMDEQSNIIYSTKKYFPGIYFYKATDKKGNGHTGKFVVQ